MSGYYGKNIKMSIFGTSHGPEIGVVCEGIPAGGKIDKDALQAFLARRAPGKNSLSTPRKEPDIPVFLSGLSDDGTLTGEPLRAVIYNTNTRSSDYSFTGADESFIPRPGHADFAARMKYGPGVDLRGGGRFSGRLTAPLCIAGGIFLQLLEQRNIKIAAHIYSVSDVCDTPFDMALVSEKEFSLLGERSDFPVLDASAGERMKAKIEEVRAAGDSVGGIVECAAVGLPAGLGEHMFDGVEGRISQIVFGIPAVKGIEFGAGFSTARLRGSENNDPFYTDGEKIFTKTNNHGGILGGMTTGMPLVFRAAMKPTPSIFTEQDSVEMISMKNVKLNIKGRHDHCVVLRAVPVFEAAAATAVFDMLLDSKIQLMESNL